MRLLRVFPRRTRATPDDALALCRPPELFDEADAVHVSVTFSWDKPAAERLAEQWRYVAPVTVGGPAYGDAGLDFVPGRYLKHGYTITSRGCPRRCWFCKVWKRHPAATPLPAIAEGWNVLDDNLLACPHEHVEAVLSMLRRQKRRVAFTGGLDALLLDDYYVGLLASLPRKPDVFFAFDPGDQIGPLHDAANKMRAAGFTAQGHRLRCYVLVGYPKDSFFDAETRLCTVKSLGMTPMAMLWRPATPDEQRYAPDRAWRQFQRLWARPTIIHGHADVRMAE
ncbi:hypothetical protein AGMMS50256_34620 [Betaproteobacteria bacterium]|nr:hypothetical protein AGMMS50256_34620 [Betaproteobacteria bacterium]